MGAFSGWDDTSRGTQDKGLIFWPNTHSLDCWVHDDFAGNKDPTNSKHPGTARSRSGSIISYTGCPIMLKFKICNQLGLLSTTESEYISLSTPLQEVLYVHQMISEMPKHCLKFEETQPKVHCKTFDDNSGSILTWKRPKFTICDWALIILLPHGIILSSCWKNSNIPVSCTYWHRWPACWLHWPGLMIMRP